MTNKPLVSNAKKALNQMKLEMAGELGIQSEHVSGANKTSYESGVMGGNLGGMMSKKLVELGERELIREYNNKNN
ncbi:alpha/beta-type small acid-soluble spore protein [Paraclostridium bifermentans]|uniref:alpha/beta-type small acid-soluble spore protein n=1 Tax=Paraclostridium bifermentans TaxID=1490 RepID=UPI00290CD34E|nr:alpha/beta-type small acid-soluble spore protein [Paraclostridium bifermentans]MDU3802197.1 alpha/beta-type small acid-soluble spore protein [Paraclostridium bifermentans]